MKMTHMRKQNNHVHDHKNDTESSRICKVHTYMYLNLHLSSHTYWYRSIQTISKHTITNQGRGLRIFAMSKGELFIAITDHINHSISISDTYTAIPANSLHKNHNHRKAINLLFYSLLKIQIKIAKFYANLLSEFMLYIFIFNRIKDLIILKLCGSWKWIHTGVYGKKHP